MNIKKVSELTGLSIDTIRYYERIGIIGQVPRKDNGIRDFGERSLNQLNFARFMRKAGMSIESLKAYLILIYENDATTISARKEILQKSADDMQEKINDLATARDYLQEKIDNYDEHMRESERKLTK
ncbi:MerR family transcriptional regulator [Lactococcus hodotermopsidis]|uniref:MerR family transcriptional regulator n=1 Tax=Pseudolactococcus hodotermopsidis TaxID=2709157 RepID=A0A6A0BD83_9LACT|nr:MerR family transcriptional regulator [Lactococcus hodotermopsidis]GFH42331.1 MerR family transcriptional regulator [Lactococcus hodotermopsidis]